MLNGIDPIIIFQFSKTVASTLAKNEQNIPVTSQEPTQIDFPPIPIYLSEQFTGLYIESEDKSIDLSTDVQTKTDGSSPDVNQKGIASTVSINLIGLRDSIGLNLICALADQILEKATAKEYTITYLHGATTIFRGILHSFSVNQTAENNKLAVKIDLSKGEKTPVKTEVTPSVSANNGTIDNLKALIASGGAA